MKKVLVLALALTMAFSFTACGGGKKDDNAAPSEDVADEKQDTEEDEAEEEDADDNAKDTAGNAGADISSAIDASTTSDTEPVPLGQWAKTARYATEDETYLTVYVRITNVTTATDDADYIQTSVDQHNANGYDFSQIDLASLELPSDVELCVMDYEIYIPEEFPSPEYGLSEPTIMFSESNIGGGGIPSADGTSTYIGLGSNTEDLTLEADATYAPGNTYSFRRLYTMVKGYTDYVFEFTSYPDGTVETSADIMYYAYFANK